MAVGLGVIVSSGSSAECCVMTLKLQEEGQLRVFLLKCLPSRQQFVHCSFFLSVFFHALSCKGSDVNMLRGLCDFHFTIKRKKKTCNRNWT